MNNEVDTLRDSSFKAFALCALFLTFKYTTQATQAGNGTSGATMARQESIDTSTVLSLNNIREQLIRLEDTIIFALIERAQFAHNQSVYEIGATFLTHLLAHMPFRFLKTLQS